MMKKIMFILFFVSCFSVFSDDWVIQELPQPSGELILESIELDPLVMMNLFIPSARIAFDHRDKRIVFYVGLSRKITNTEKFVLQVGNKVMFATPRIVKYTTEPTMNHCAIDIGQLKDVDFDHDMILIWDFKSINRLLGKPAGSPIKASDISRIKREFAPERFDLFLRYDL